MKICVLGNSHVASVKNGWDEICSEYSDFELTFFASRQKRLAELKLEKSRLVPQTEALARSMAFTSGGMDCIDLKSYGLFLVYGLDLVVPSVDVRCSNAVKRQACLDVMSKSINIRLCEKIRRASDRRIYIGHNPQRAIPSPRPESRVNKLTYSDAVSLMDEHLSIERAYMVPQPQQTLVHQWFTDRKFSIGSTRLDVGDEIAGELHPDTDVTHMNKEFGRLWLDDFFRMISRAA